MPGSIGHLAARFFDFLTARPLSEQEVDQVRVWLSSAEAELFFDQMEPDQAHGYSSASSVLASGVDEPRMLRAALLHDVGKRHARLGVIHRVVASLLIKLHAPMTSRMAAYRDHGLLGAIDLERAGSDDLVVEFARHHHGARPGTIPEDRWLLLKSADVPAKAGVGRQRR